MPHGGKRPGAGAPKGNFNGVRTGKHSQRMLEVYLLLVSYPPHLVRDLAKDLHNRGFFPPPSRRFNGDLRGVVAYLHNRFFDSAIELQSNPIKSNQPRAGTQTESPANQLQIAAPQSPNEPSGPEIEKTQ